MNAMSLPHVAHERAYVATILALPQLIDGHRIDPADFGERSYATTLEAILALHLRGTRVTPMAVRAELERGGHGRIATAEYLAQFDGCIETDLEPVCLRIRELAHIRHLRLRAADLERALAKHDLSTARGLIATMSAPDLTLDRGSPVYSLGELMDLTHRAISVDRTQQQRDARMGLPVLSRNCRLAPGMLTVIGAQTSVGKSTLMLNELLDMATRTTDRVECGLISVEDPEEDFGAKIVGQFARVNPARMWNERLTPDDVQAIAEARMRQENRDAPFFLCHVADRALDTVLARMEFMARARRCRVIGVDYIQAIAHRNGKDIRERIDRTLEELISLAGRLGVSLVLASQLSRPEKGNPFKEPNLIDLKESGSIENRAQNVILLWRKNDQPGQPIHGKVAKVKRLPIGVRFKLGRHHETSKLVELADEPSGPTEATYTKPARRTKPRQQDFTAPMPDDRDF